jgi:hypothetical protein
MSIVAFLDDFCTPATDRHILMNTLDGLHQHVFMPPQVNPLKPVVI